MGRLGQVETAEGLTIRVINNVMKQVDVKPRFSELFESEQYPKSFPYRQKVVLMTQKIDGVDVCLYCFYLQVSLASQVMLDVHTGCLGKAWSVLVSTWHSWLSDAVETALGEQGFLFCSPVRKCSFPMHCTAVSNGLLRISGGFSRGD